MTDEQQPKQVRRTLFRHPLAAIGGALAAAGMLSFGILAFIDLTSPTENPYRGLITFIGFPVIVAIGVILFLVAIRIQVVRARRRGEEVRFSLTIEPSDPRYMRSLFIFLGATALLLGLVAWGGFKGYEATDSAAFCGEACHTVMEPQWVTYQESPHARVTCAECHIGPGAKFWVRSKLDGIRQVLAVATDSFDRPVPTPVRSLRPARETCEGCHWPDQFYGDKLVTKTYFRTDEVNSPWTISLAVKIGGANPRSGDLEGIHWHMLAGDVEYIATDEKRQEIGWVRYRSDDGTVVEFADPDAGLGPDTPGVEVRTLDCVDCHNRPSHDFLAPATALNLELTKGTIDRDLPYVRWQGLVLLNAPYETKPEAEKAIRDGLITYYEQNYPDLAQSRRSDIDQAADTLVSIYDANFFPEMKTDYRVREDNLSHFVNKGCFRCHFSDLQTSDGATIPSSCDSCHLIVAQGPSADVTDLEQDLAGLGFEHPVDIGGVWQRISCTQCHTPEQGY